MLNQLTGQEITSQDLQGISELVRQQINLEKEVNTYAEALQFRQELLKKLSEVTIPDAMMAIGLSEVKLSTGEAVTIKKFYSASISAENTEAAMAWLRETGNDDIIKNQIALSFGKGEDERARETATLLIARGLTPEQKIFVHHSTLKSFVKERIEDGKELPNELFGVFVGNKTKITPATK